MLELMDLVLLATICTVAAALFSGIFSVIIWKLRDWSLDRRLKAVEEMQKSIEMTEKSALGVEARQAKAAERTQAMLELGNILKSKEGDKKEALMSWAATHPDFVLSMAGKLGVKL